MIKKRMAVNRANHLTTIFIGLSGGHSNGQGVLESIQCSVQFFAFIPLDLDNCPYYLFFSRGTHSHPPPPPTRTPTSIMQGLLSALQSTQNPQITTSK